MSSISEGSELVFCLWVLPLELYAKDTDFKLKTVPIFLAPMLYNRNKFLFFVNLQMQLEYLASVNCKSKTAQLCFHCE